MTKALTKNSSKLLGVEYCDFCDGEVVPQKVTMTYRRQGNEHLFHDVDAEVCRKCGERYYSARALDELDRQLGVKKKRVTRTAA